ncbi:Gfo/Idh/MocA family oxidoreductase [uncultured Anaerovibrio sp.]|uniref:Gfo/Idh/MocA family protein n=1 Tax=uncultured Anaerovibrio sp. TaxID=361586 RepID=UPI0025FBC161|nr:Gfo/Idh/MocA family oxidoreductase [uncultured Anaerovibrio sp.]
MKVCFVGIGSIAKRHIRNLGEICNERGIDLQIDAFRRFSKDKPEGFSNIYKAIESVPTDYDIIFITNPTEKHLETLRLFHDKGKHFFIEKPVVSVNQINEAKEFQLHDIAVYYIACPLRYNAVIQYIKEHISVDDVISVRCISSSYLPEWRPGQDYRETYSAHKDMGGGVSIDLIHEWDYLTYLLGWPEKMHSFRGKKSSLEIDSDDYAIYIAEYSDKIVELHLDYFGRKTIREIQLFTKDDTIIGDIANNRITFLKSGKEIDFKEQRDDYQTRELKHFLEMVNGKIESDSDFYHAIDVLKLTQGEL